MILHDNLGILAEFQACILLKINGMENRVLIFHSSYYILYTGLCKYMDPIKYFYDMAAFV